MKNKYFFYLTAIITLLFSNMTFSQSINDDKNGMKISNKKIVQKLNTPTKMWINGGWKINHDGTRLWQKGYWKFEAKTFQQKSQIFRKKLNDANKV